MKLLILLGLMVTSLSFAQPLKIRNTQGGLFSLGVRTTLSTFNHGEFGNTGFGLGGQYRIQLALHIVQIIILDGVSCSTQ